MSNVVDERVVEMRFDNQQFEKNAKESMSTIDKLKDKCRMTNTINPTHTITSLNSTIVTPPAKPKPAMIITDAISNAINSVISNIIFTPPFLLLFH